MKYCVYIRLVYAKQHRADEDRHNAYGIEHQFGSCEVRACDEVCSHQKTADEEVCGKGKHTEFAEIDKGQSQCKGGDEKAYAVDDEALVSSYQKCNSCATRYDDEVDGAVVHLAHNRLDFGILYGVVGGGVDVESKKTCRAQHCRHVGQSCGGFYQHKHHAYDTENNP